ncbi:MAG: hypothetical protein AAGC95_18635 [Pseudomonadota bacterium]
MVLTLAMCVAGGAPAVWAQEAPPPEPDKLPPADAFGSLALARVMTKSACSCIFVERRSVERCTSTDTSIWRLYSDKPNAFMRGLVQKRPDRGPIDFPLRNNGEFVVEGKAGGRVGAVSFTYDNVVLSRTTYARSNPGCTIEF